MVTDLYLHIGLCQTNLETTFLPQNFKKGSVLHNIFAQVILLRKLTKAEGLEVRHMLLEATLT